MDKDRALHGLTFVSILLGFALWKYFEAWSIVLSSRSLVLLVSVPVIVTAVLTVLLVEFWWATFEYIKFGGDRFREFLLSIGETMCFYLMGATLVGVFESAKTTGKDVTQIYLDQRLLIYVPCMAFLVMATLEESVTRRFSANLMRAGGVVVCIAAAVSTKGLVHYVLAVSGLVLVVVFTGLRVLVWDRSGGAAGLGAR